MTWSGSPPSMLLAAWAPPPLWVSISSSVTRGIGEGVCKALANFLSFQTILILASETWCYSLLREGLWSWGQKISLVGCAGCGFGLGEWVGLLPFHFPISRSLRGPTLGQFLGLERHSPRASFLTASPSAVGSTDLPGTLPVHSSPAFLSSSNYSSLCPTPPLHTHHS